MTVLIRAEVLKLRTVRGPWLLLAAAPLQVIAGISGVMTGRNAIDGCYQAQMVVHVDLTSIFTLVFGILVVAGEYRHGVIGRLVSNFARWVPFNVG